MHERNGTLQGHGGLQLVWHATFPAGAARAAILLVHGHGEHSGRYAALPAQFVPRGYAVWAYDLRGHGRSSGQRGHVLAW
jgi:alpha-beta hydrolase superfamily lysophospholipase